MSYADLDKPCGECGEPLGKHMVGGPGPYHPRPMKEVKRGFNFRFLCFPLGERSNWKWGREHQDQMFAVGPMRFMLFAVTIRRRS